MTTARDTMHAGATCVRQRETSTVAAYLDNLASTS